MAATLLDSDATASPVLGSVCATLVNISSTALPQGLQDLRIAALIIHFFSENTKWTLYMSE